MILNGKRLANWLWSTASFHKSSMDCSMFFVLDSLVVSYYKIPHTYSCHEQCLLLIEGSALSLLIVRDNATINTS